MDQITSLTKFRNPYGNQEIELQQVDYEAGGTSMLRLRIRERGARFTIFDIDPVTAKFWAEQMSAWAAPLAAADSGKNGDTHADG
jgi:type II secretory pathway component HofQ